MPLHAFVCLAFVAGPTNLLQSLLDMIPIASSPRKENEKSSGKSFAISIFVLILAVAAVGYCLMYSCLDHQFLLSDNRFLNLHCFPCICIRQANDSIWLQALYLLYLEVFLIEGKNQVNFDDIASCIDDLFSMCNISRAILILPYVFCVASGIRNLLKVHGPVWVSIFLIAVAITLVPARLLEFRYFTPAVIFAYLNFPEVLLN